MIVTPTNSASSPLDATDAPHFGQKPRSIAGCVPVAGYVWNHVGSPPGPVHANPSSGKPTHAITGAPESP